MKWVKRFAAGALAAALSLALLCGCSDSTKLENVKELNYNDSMLYTRTYRSSASNGEGWAMECTNLSNGQKIIMAEMDQTKFYIGTEQNGVVKITQRYSQDVFPGIYQADIEAGTYKSIEKLGAVEQVISDLFLSGGTPNSDCVPTKMEAASATRSGENYYVERAEYASGTAVVYYLVKNSSNRRAEAKYVDIYLPGQKTPQARFKVTREEGTGNAGSKLIPKYPVILDELTKDE